MGFRKNTGNRAFNTIGIIPRTLGTGLHTTEDVTKTALFTTLNMFEGVGKTATNIKDAVHNACTKGPWYHRIWKAPLSLATTPFMAIEGVGETLRYSGCNLLRYSRDTIANPFINFGRGIKRMFSRKDIGDFKFEKVEKSDVTPKMRLASLFDSTPAPAPRPAPAPAPAPRPAPAPAPAPRPAPAPAPAPAPRPAPAPAPRPVPAPAPRPAPAP